MTITQTCINCSLPIDIISDPATLTCALPHLTQSNDIPQTDEVELIKAAIADDEATALEIRRSLRALDTLREKLEDRSQAVQKRIHEHQAVLSPWRKIPEDILVRIFHCCLDASDQNSTPKNQAPIPWVLGHVCSRWRTTFAQAIPHTMSDLRQNLQSYLEDDNRTNSHPASSESNNRVSMQDTEADSGVTLLAEPATCARTSTIANLPPEVLHMIFELATPPQYLLDPLTSLVPNSLWFRTVWQKRSMIGVCTAWYHAGISLLYKHILITRLYQLPQLIRTLEACPDLFPHLVDTFTIVCYMPPSLHDQFHDHLGRFFHFCPNLHTFRYASLFPPPRHDSIPLLPIQIAHLDLSRCVSQPTIDAILKQSSKQLISLAVRFPRAEDSDTTPSPPRLSFDCLEQLTCDFCEHGTAVLTENWKLPRLRLLISESYVAIAQFCRFHGAKLRYLQFSCHMYGHVGQIPIAFQPILDACPSLEKLVLWSSAADALESFTAHPNVREFGIVYTVEQDAPRDRWDLGSVGLEKAEWAKNAFPQLTSLRLFVFVSPNDHDYLLQDVYLMHAAEGPVISAKVPCTVMTIPGLPDVPQDFYDTATETDSSYQYQSHSSNASSRSQSANSDSGSEHDDSWSLGSDFDEQSRIREADMDLALEDPET